MSCTRARENSKRTQRRRNTFRETVFRIDSACGDAGNPPLCGAVLQSFYCVQIAGCDSPQSFCGFEAALSGKAGRARQGKSDFDYHHRYRTSGGLLCSHHFAHCDRGSDFRFHDLLYGAVSLVCWFICDDCLSFRRSCDSAVEWKAKRRQGNGVPQCVRRTEQLCAGVCAWSG